MATINKRLAFLITLFLFIPHAWAVEPRYKFKYPTSWSWDWVTDLTSAGTVTGSDVAFTNLVSCGAVATDANGNFFCSNSAGTGTVTSISQGTNMSFSVNPITATGTINLTASPSVTNLTASGTVTGAVVDTINLENSTSSGSGLVTVRDSLKSTGTVTGQVVHAVNALQVGSDYITDITGSNLSIVNGALTGSSSGGNSFETIATPAGTSPVADSSTDTLTITETSFLTITGTAATDTIDITQVTTDIGTDGLIAANAVALGTDTTGNYVATIADSGNTTVTVANSGAESAAVTLNVIDVNCTGCLSSTELGADSVGASEVIESESYTVANLTATSTVTGVSVDAINIANSTSTGNGIVNVRDSISSVDTVTGLIVGDFPNIENSGTLNSGIVRVRDSVQSTNTVTGLVVDTLNLENSTANGGALVSVRDSLNSTGTVTGVIVNARTALQVGTDYIFDITGSGLSIVGGALTASAGSGDITSVGDVASGAAFDGTQGTEFTFNNAGGDATQTFDGADMIFGNTTISASREPVAGTNTGTILVTPVFTSAAGQQAGIRSIPSASPGSASSQTYFALAGNSGGSGANLTNASLAGFNGFTSMSGTGTVAVEYGGYIQNQVFDTATVTNAYGLYSDNPSKDGGATITTNYGIFVNDQTSGSSDYGIAIAGADTAALWISSGADNTDAPNGIMFGQSKDTNLYRSAANTIKTDDAVISAVSAQAPFFVSAAADPADAGAVRLGNAELIEWEASPAGTDTTITVDTAEVVQVSTSLQAANTVTGVTVSATGALQVRSDYVSDITGLGLSVVGGQLTVQREVQIQVLGDAEPATTGDGKRYVDIGPSLDGYTLTAVYFEVTTVGTTNTLNVDIDKCSAVATGSPCSGTVVDMLTVNATIDSNEDDTGTAAAAYTIGAANAGVSSGQVLRLNIDAIQTTPSRGLRGVLTFSKTP